MNVRYEFVLRSFQDRLPFVELCREFGISPKTGYKWKQRFLEDGRAGLQDQSRQPKSSPGVLTEDLVCKMVRLKKAHEDWGPRKIREVFGRQYPECELPCESSFKRVLDKAGLVERRRVRRSDQSGRLQNRIEPAAPNDLWTVDFKGWWYTPCGERCEPFTVRDAYSRYILATAILPDAKTHSVRAACERLFELYGLPRAIRSDNGSPFASRRGPFGLSRLSVWWLALGIDLDRTDPGRPDQNGAHERMHRDLAKLERRIAGDLNHHQAALETWRQEYNHERPHEALGMRRPVEVYVKSPRRYEGTPERLAYPEGYLERTVTKNGLVHLHNQTVWTSEALGGWNVGLLPVSDEEYELYFAHLNLGRINLRTVSFQRYNKVRQA